MPHPLHSRFIEYIGIRETPDAHEIDLYQRAQKYIQKLQWIPGIEMVGIVNSLSMYATHPDSDIDLFILTKPGYLWLVRILVTLTFSTHGVWRRGEDIAGNFCLSFYASTQAMKLEEIAIENDIYLYHWIYYLHPILIRGERYEQFLRANLWVEIDESRKQENLQFSTRRPQKKYTLDILYQTLDRLFRWIFLRKTLREYIRLGEPDGVIITDHMLKFHPLDRRIEIRDAILK